MCQAFSNPLSGVATSDFKRHAVLQSHEPGAHHPLTQKSEGFIDRLVFAREGD
jgi:hypothetical protein